jgi:hypothetical protein
MFSLAISSIWVCWRRHSPVIAAASSGSAATSGASKKPVSRAAEREETGEIARTAPLAERGRRGWAAELQVYHISGADVSRLLAIASQPAVKCPRRVSLRATAKLVE